MLLIFDCDGVVLDSMMLHGEVESEAYGKLRGVLEASHKPMCQKFLNGKRAAKCRQTSMSKKRKKRYLRNA